MNQQPIFPFAIIFSLFVCFSCQQPVPSENKKAGKLSDIQATALDGTPLMTITDSEATFRKKDSLLAIAREEYESHPDSLERLIWFGRRTAYLSMYHAAIKIFSEGMERFPGSPELYRHRGHRYISIRELDSAIVDFQTAAKLAEGRQLEIEPDGLPNKLNIPLSNLQFNIYYHLALAHYLKRNFSDAAQAWEKCMEYSVNPDLVVATSDWLYMTYRRLGKVEEAKALLENINTDMTIIENDAYHKRLLMYKGEIKPGDLLDFENMAEDAQISVITQGYGVGNWYLYNGEEQKAFDIFEKVVHTDYWPAFGYIAAEAELFYREK